MDSSPTNLRPVQELLEDAARYEQWALRTKSNPEISERFARLAKEVRDKAGA